MNFTNCKRCKTIFKYSNNASQSGKKYCPLCITKILEEVSLLHSVISENEDISLSELSKKTKISETVIVKYVTANKIPVVSGCKFNKCRKCGASIKAGTYCNKCK